MIHGAALGASSLVNWKLNIEPLAAAGFAVYAYDQPGFGYTDNPSDHSIEYRVTHSKALINALGSADSQTLAKKHSGELREYQPSLENMRKLTLGTIFNKELVTEELVRERYEMSTGRNDEAQLQRRNAPRQRPVYDDLSQLRVKALLLWGNNDRGVSVERRLELFGHARRRIPSIRQVCPLGTMGPS